MVINGDFEDITKHNLWVSNNPDGVLIAPYVLTPEPNYSLLLGHENSADHQIYQAITVPTGTKSLEIKFFVYVRSLELTSIPFDYLYIELIDTATSTLILEQQIDPITNGFSPQGQ